MSVRNITKPVTAQAASLKTSLANELGRNQPGDVQPLILMEGGGQQGSKHVYVIWDDWRDLSAIERSEIIMDAFEEVMGKEGCLEITVAMGLTAQEAKRLNIG